MDFAKGILMLAIVFAHVSTLMKATGSTGSSSSPILAFGYSALILYFVISGYFYNPAKMTPEKAKARILKLAVAFVLVYTILPTILYGYMAVLGNQDLTVDGLLRSYIVLLGSPEMFNAYDPTASYFKPVNACFGGAYYIMCIMFGSALLYAVGPHIYGDAKKTVAIVVVCIVAAALMRQFLPVRPPFYIDFLPMVLALMIMGSEMGRFRLVERMESLELVRDWRFWAALICAVALSAVMFTYLSPGMTMHLTNYGAYDGLSAFPYFVEMAMVSFVFLFVFSLLSRIPGLYHLMDYIGKHTLAVIFFHLFFVKLILAPFVVFDTSTWIPYGTLSLPVAFAFSLALALGISFLASKQDVIYARFGALFGRGKKDSPQ